MKDKDILETLGQKRVVMVVGELIFFTPVILDAPRIMSPSKHQAPEMKKVFEALNKLTIGQILGSQDEKPAWLNIKVVEPVFMAKDPRFTFPGKGKK